MTLENYIARSLLMYPLLYKSENMSHSVDLILEQTFLTLGNGLYWHDGYLVDSFYQEELVPYGQEWVMSAKEAQRIEKANKEYAEFKPEERKYSAYPLYSDSAILNLPADIKPDWLQGAAMAIERAIKYYKNPAEYSNNSYYPTLVKMKDYEDEKNGVVKADIADIFDRPDTKEILMALFAAKSKKPTFVPKQETVEALMKDFHSFRRSQLRFLNKAKKNCQRIKAEMA